MHVVATYGSAETAGGCVYDGLPLDGVAVALGESGRIRIAGPTLFRRVRRPARSDRRGPRRRLVRHLRRRADRRGRSAGRDRPGRRRGRSSGASTCRARPSPSGSARTRRSRPRRCSVCPMPSGRPRGRLRGALEGRGSGRCATPHLNHRRATEFDDLRDSVAAAPPAPGHPVRSSSSTRSRCWPTASPTARRCCARGPGRWP